MRTWSERVQSKWSDHHVYPWLIFFFVTLGTFMVNVDSSIINVALPLLVDTFQTTPQSTQWIISAYLLIVTAILPTVGKLSDMMGRKGFFITGISVFTLGSLLSALSINLSMLIFFRILQAVGAAMIMGNVMPIIADTFPEGKRGRPLGIVGSIVAVGTIVGPGMGGFLIDWLGWRSIFWINVPFGILAVIGSYFLLSSGGSNRAKHFDIWGSITFFAAMSSIILYVANGSIWGWSSGASWLTLGLSLGFWSAFIRVEVKHQQPIIHLSMFRNPTFTIGNLTGYLSFVLMMFPSILIPLFLHEELKMEPSPIGFLMVSQAIGMILVSPLSGAISDRFGSRGISVMGMGVVTLGMGLLAQIGNDSSYFEMFFYLFVFGIGMGLFQSPNNVSVLESVKPNQMGTAGAMMATVRNFGRVSGVTITISLLHFGMRQEPGININAHGLAFVFNIGLWIAILSTFLLAYQWIKTKEKGQQVKQR